MPYFVTECKNFTLVSGLIAYKRR